MLKKKYSGKIVLIIAVAAFAIAMVILSYLRNKYQFGSTKNALIIVGIALITAFLAIRVTVLRRAEIKVQRSDYPPEGINSIQAGCIIDGTVNARDISSAFFYMGHKGYIDITEYELQHFEFRQGRYPEDEEKSIQYIYRAIFGDHQGKKSSLNAACPDTQVVRLSDVSKKLIDAVKKIQFDTYNGISSRRNKEIADMTGKVMGFKESLVENRDDKVQQLVDENPSYLFEILPYAYAFAMTAKINSNFEPVAVDMPKWYHPYGVSQDYVFDVLVYNSMLRNLPEQLKNEVYSHTIDTYPNVSASVNARAK